MKTGYRIALIMLSIVIAALAVWLWLRTFEVSGDKFSALLERLNWEPILPLFGLLVGHVALSSWRWSLIEMGLGGPRPRFDQAFAVGALAMGLGTFLPSPVVNIACRGMANKINRTGGIRGMLSSGIDQISDLFVVGLLAVPAFVGFLYRSLELYLAGAAVMVVLGLAAIWLLPGAARTTSLLFRVPFLQRFAPLTDRRLALMLYGISLARLINLTLMTLLIQAIAGAGNTSAIIAGVPLITLAISAAMLPGGLGVSEWSFSVVLARFAVSRGDIVLFVLMNRTVLTALSLTLALLVLAVIIGFQIPKKQV